MLKKFSNKKITALMVVLAMVFSFILPIPVKAAEISETKNSNVTEKTDKIFLHNICSDKQMSEEHLNKIKNLTSIL